MKGKTVKPYSVDIDVTTRHTVEIHANDENEAQQIAENMNLDVIDLEDGLRELRSVKTTNVEEITDVD